MHKTDSERIDSPAQRGGWSVNASQPLKYSRSEPRDDERCKSSINRIKDDVLLRHDGSKYYEHR